jgi:hypothetical protein
VRAIMKKISVILVLALALSIHCSYAFDLPVDALRLLAEATAEPCSICAKQELEKAFKIMNDRFISGHEIITDESCRFVKVLSGGNNELSLTCYPTDTFMKSIKGDERPPQIVFKFYTSQKHLVGISDKDYTGKEIADMFDALPSGAVIEGRIRLIPYKYGDGPTYNYFKHTNKLQIHCVVLQLKPVSL